MNQLKGFAIVELILVILIIAVLAGIVLAGITKYTNNGKAEPIDSGKDAAIEANLDTVLSSGSVFYAANQSYAGFCGSSGVSAVKSAITLAGGNFICNVNTAYDKWCACSTLTTAAKIVFCVDSMGNKKMVSASDCSGECSSAGVCL